jgi:nucleoside-diphosphate-sugar epimerase
VHVSTTDIYGYPEVPCAEDHPIVDAGLPYNRTKGQAEALVWQAASTLPITIVRPATIYGPRGKDFTQEIATMLRQRVMATIDGGRAPGGFVYVDTVAQAMLDVSVHPATLSQAYNIANGSGATWATYLRLFAEQLGTRTPWINLTFSNAMALARVMETPHRLLHLSGRPLLTRHAVYLLGRNQEFPIAKARAQFSFNPSIPLAEGIARSIAWLKDTQAPKR